MVRAARPAAHNGTTQPDAAALSTPAMPPGYRVVPSRHRFERRTGLHL